jgi:hypothetical protein
MFDRTDAKASKISAAIHTSSRRGTHFNFSRQKRAEEDFLENAATCEGQEHPKVRENLCAVISSLCRDQHATTYE